MIDWTVHPLKTTARRIASLLSRDLTPFVASTATDTSSDQYSRQTMMDSMPQKPITQRMRGTAIDASCDRESGHYRRCRGVTVVELMIALAVAAVVLGLALPAFNGLMLQQEMTGRAIDFKMAVNYARSEAVRRGANVSVVAGGATAADEWGQGFCVAVGAPANCAASLRTFDPADADRVLDMQAPLNNVAVLTFNSRGLLNNLAPGQNAVMRICSTDTTEDPGRSLAINAMGRTTVEELICHP